MQPHFWRWLALSALLHATVIASPGWELPELDPDLQQARLDTRLVPQLPPIAQKPAPEPKPVKPPAAKPVPSPSPAAPVAKAPPEATPQPPPEIAPPRIPDPPPPPVSPESTPVAVPSGPTFADVWPRSGRLVFKVLRGDGFHAGQAEHRWQHDGERYQLRAVTETVGLAALFHAAKVVQESSGVISASGLQPLEFRVIRDGKLREAARVDPSQNTVFLSNDKPVAMRGQVQDVLTLFYQHGAVPDSQAQYAVTIVTGRRVGEYQVSFEGNEKIETPWGERSVRHLKMYSSTKNDASEIWLDDITRLPFKIRYRDGKGEIFDQLIESVELGKTE